MKRTRNEIRQCVVDSIKEVMTDSQSVTIDDKTDPIQHLGLDSYDGVVCACALSNKLGYNIPENVNPFVDDDRRRSRCMSEIVDMLLQLIEQKEKN